MKTVIINDIRGNIIYNKEIPEDTSKELDAEVPLLVEQLIKNGIDLSYANLCGLNLAFANLEGANFYGANLTDTNLNRANLKRACLVRADLRGANLRGADLRKCTTSNIYNANLDDAIIKRDVSILKDGYFCVNNLYVGYPGILEIYNTNRGIYFKFENGKMHNVKKFKDTSLNKMIIKLAKERFGL